MKTHDINKQVEDAINKQNNMPVDDFDGLSANQMEQLLYHPFEGDTVVKFAAKAKFGIFVESPLFIIAWELLNTISESGGIKLTSKGYLPLKLVKSIYDKGYFPDDDIETGEIELRSEYDWLLLFVVKQLLLLTEIAENKNNVLTFTERGRELFTKKSDFVVYMDLLKAFCLGYSWASNDSFESEEIAQVGFMYVIYLLKKYGGTPREARFYSKKYFQAFPTLYVADDDLDEDEEDDDDWDEDDEDDAEEDNLDKESLLKDEPDTDEDFEEDEDSEVDEDSGEDKEDKQEEDRLYCFEARFFWRFCEWFGLAEVDEDYIMPGGEFDFELFERAGEVKRSKLFERIVQ
ncbi:MAG TPA: hypothetical protein VHO03_07540 [Ignavibacteriales bacterium]|nr:hypothetical protein [Ignavibacteriales bacterium]